MHRQINRRGFISQAVTAFAAISSSRTFAQRYTPPSRTVTMGIIGYGGRGNQMLPVFLNQPFVRFLAVCDCVKSRREQAKAVVDAFNGNSDCTAYDDFRELLARPDIDALYIATGDRWHARLAIYAMAAGKDVYCEKPISRSMEEGEAVNAAAKRFGRIYQGGVQRRTVGNFITARELATSGRLGKIHTVHAGMAGMGVSATNKFLPEERLDTNEVNWDMWLGAAPFRPFNMNYVKGGWHSQYDFHGDLSEWGSHTVDLCQLALGRELTAPTRYVPINATRVEASYPDGVKLVMRNGGFSDSCAIRLEGDEGWVETDDSGQIKVSDPALLQGRKILTERWTRPVAHPAEFINCVRNRRRPSAPPDSLHFSHVCCHAASIAYHLNRALEFDPATLTFPNDAEATRLTHRSARAPWTLA